MSVTDTFRTILYSCCHGQCHGILLALLSVNAISIWAGDKVAAETLSWVRINLEKKKEKSQKNPNLTRLKSDSIEDDCIANYSVSKVGLPVPKRIVLANNKCTGDDCTTGRGVQEKSGIAYIVLSSLHNRVC